MPTDVLLNVPSARFASTVKVFLPNNRARPSGALAEAYDIPYLGTIVWPEPLSTMPTSRATDEFLELISETIPGEIHGITTDFGRGKCFVKPIRETFPDAFHRVCLVHFLRYLNFQLPKTQGFVIAAALA